MMKSARLKSVKINSNAVGISVEANAIPTATSGNVFWSFRAFGVFVFISLSRNTAIVIKLKQTNAEPTIRSVV